MHPGLSLRSSQHLALTPQLQQSIRLLQLSTLELTHEVEQQLADNPFLERDSEQAEAETEALGLPQLDTPVSLGDRLSEAAADIAATQPAPSSSLHGGDTDHSAHHDGAHDATDTDTPGTDSPDLNWDGDGTVDTAAHDSEWGNDAPTTPRSHGQNDSDGSDPADWNSAPLTLQAHLHQQALGLHLSPTQQAALYALIESLDDDGYLIDPLPELAAALAAQQEATAAQPCTPTQRQARQAAIEQHLSSALGHLQQMDPTGVGARNLAECLRLQVLELRNTPASRAALALCEQPLNLLAKRDTKRLSALCGCDEASVRAGLAVIARLEPKPGRRFAQVERNAIVPDVVVRRSGSGSGFTVELNPDVMPRLRVQDVYASALRGHKGDSASGLQQRLQEARWFIKNIQQRFDTILRVSRAIVERQRAFFVQGELAMRPLVLREIADELGLHESTISRVTSAKYMATPWGTYELKYFFGSGLGTDSGAHTSSTAVRALIRQLIASEHPTHPLSDQQLCDLLKAQGITCARRTVAKYRKALRIAPASLRKNPPLPS